MKRGILLIIGTADGVTVAVERAGKRAHVHIPPGRNPGGLLQAIETLLPPTLRHHVHGIAVAIGDVSFSTHRVIITTANALAHAWRCPVTVLPVYDLHDLGSTYAKAEHQLRTAQQRSIVPQYSVAPHITAPRSHTGTHHNAGGVVYDPKQGAVLFVQRKDNRVVGTPKGHREGNEPLVETAKREIAEETGVVGLRYIATLPSAHYLSDDHGTLPKKIPHHLHSFLFVRVGSRSVARVKTGEVANLRLLWVPVPGGKPPATLHRDLRPVFTQAVKILRLRGLLAIAKQAVSKRAPHS